MDEVYVSDPRSRIFESDREERWAEAHARLAGSVLIKGDELLAETKPPTWVSTAGRVIYDAFRVKDNNARRFDIQELSSLAQFRSELRQPTVREHCERLELCELEPAGFERRAVAIGIEAMDLAAEVGQQTVAEVREFRGVTGEYRRLQDLRKREAPPKAWEARDIVDTVSRMHDALHVDYRSRGYFEPRARHFVKEAVLRFRMNDDAEHRLSAEDLDALEGL